LAAGGTVKECLRELTGDENVDPFSGEDDDLRPATGAGNSTISFLDTTPRWRSSLRIVRG
jgi:hypothetical protein